jgi:hypothetical protein
MRNEPPETIKNPDSFFNSLPCEFDGIFDWSFLIDCFIGTNIKPMDIDAIIEKNGNFLVIETKSKGIPIPLGQQITFEALWELGVFSILFIYGKKNPETFAFWYPRNGKKKRKTISGYGETEVKNIIKKWFEWAQIK